MEQSDEQKAKKIANEFTRNMLVTRKGKYAALLFGMGLAGLLFSVTGVKQPAVRSQFLRSFYLAMRAYDDVADADSPIPNGHHSREAYVGAKIDFIDQGLRSPTDTADFPLLYSFSLASQFGEDFSEPAKYILQSLQFDAKRTDAKERGEPPRFYSASELQDRLFFCDIKGTGKGMLQLYGTEPNYKRIEDLGTACRISYDLRDYASDVANGLVNISQEDADRLEISLDNLSFATSSGVRNWFTEQSIQGLGHIASHDALIALHQYSPAERATFPFVYRNPAKRRLLKQLRKVEAISSSRV